MGLFWQNGGSPSDFTTLHGQTVQMYGQGIYAFDTSFKAPILRGTDALTFFICVPLLVVALLLYRRGSLRGGLFLVGVLSYFLYNSASLTLGVAYNPSFLLYAAFFSASLFAFILAFTAVDTRQLAAHVSPGLPHRAIAALMFVSGLGLLFVWLGDIIPPLLHGTYPAIASYTTEVTYVFDLSIIVPVLILTGIFLLRRAPLGYLLAPMMLVMLTIVGLMVTLQTVFQTLAGITLTPGELIGKAGSFVILALVAFWLNVRFFRSIAKPAAARRKLKPSRA